MMDVKTLQNDIEIARFAEIVRGSGAASYLEVGSKFGGSLWRVANEMPKGSRIVSVDLPNGTVAWEESRKSLESVIKELNRRGYDAKIIWGDSTAANVIDQVAKLGPFECVFLDGNHTMPFVQKDWKNYCQTAKIVGFHDIGWRRPPTYGGVRIDVPEFWEEIKATHQHEEIRLDLKDNGIGVLWR